VTSNLLAQFDKDDLGFIWARTFKSRRDRLDGRLRRRRAL
jgi:hypothetical protein